MWSGTASGEPRPQWKKSVRSGHLTAAPCYPADLTPTGLHPVSRRSLLKQPTRWPALRWRRYRHFAKHTLRTFLQHPSCRAVCLISLPLLWRLHPQCRSKGFNDISVSVLDLAGRILVSKTMVGVPNLIPTIAEAKAGAAIGTHSSSRTLKDKYVPERTPQLIAMTMLGASVHQPFAAVPGGVLCRDAESGAVIGAIGVSGASADEDEHCAVIGAHACGFQTEPAKSALQ